MFMPTGVPEQANAITSREVKSGLLIEVNEVPLK